MNMYELPMCKVRLHFLHDYYSSSRVQSQYIATGNGIIIMIAVLPQSVLYYICNSILVIHKIASIILALNALFAVTGPYKIAM